MAQFEFTIALPSAVTWAYASRSVEKGRLKALSIVPVVGITTHAQTLLIVGTTFAAPQDERPNAVFFSGYVSRCGQFIWTGDYPFSYGEMMYARGRSMISVTMRICGVTDLGDP